MALFLADKISWDQEGKPPYYDVIMSWLDISLEVSCKKYIDYLYSNNKLLWPHKWMDEAHIYFR
jgi:Predicted HD superfamily hydrolase involved in NAD metabolism